MKIYDKQAQATNAFFILIILGFKKTALTGFKPVPKPSTNFLNQ